MEAIYIRPLEEQDAYVSVKWRNNPEIWKFTGAKPDNLVTIEMELSWIKKVFERTNEKRFAICLSDSNQYIGNVQLTDIEGSEAQFHIFIGEAAFWNKGIGTTATKLILEYGFDVLKLSLIYLYVKEVHKAAVKAYQNSGFKQLQLEDGFIKMEIQGDLFS
ncbi:GNAT family N-acetyltransferase [Mariniflexile sp. AS56]|uniref:GNAT family N-acetyltransferase n=1 Tax=Mariniflexile sp. AS56 TaxID=3063957 RepID=UPI0026EBB737|nr:GNAT family N-acetyltransferase [Mariniflexile sp. AS56]MDO7171355.1 GNAT family N-acetyltransferase [Mariniflexile sp. AS56]